MFEELNYLIEKVGAVFVETKEPERFYPFIGPNSFWWTPTQSKLLGERKQEMPLTDFLNYWATMRSSIKNHLYIINPYFDYHSDAEQYILNILSQKNDHIIILGDRNPFELEHIVHYKMPEPSREEYYNAFKKSLTTKKKLEQCIDYAKGMSICRAKDCYNYSQGEPEEFLDVKHFFVKTDVIEFIHPKETFEDVGGLEEFKCWFKKKAKTLNREAKKFRLSFKGGAILTGPTGVGKSLVSKAIANHAQLPLVKLDLSKCFNSYVGNSEKLLRDALQSVEDVSPCILWLDELNRFMNTSENDNGVSSRLIGIFLNWLQEHDKEVFTVATVNNFESLPKELTRPGRFDKVFYFEKPSLEEAWKIIQIHCRKKGLSFSMYDIDTIANGLLDYNQSLTGAEIEARLEENILDLLSLGAEDIEPESLGLSKEE